jgi:hypothetical protein
MGREAGRLVALLGDGGPGVKFDQCNFGRFMPGLIYTEFSASRMAFEEGLRDE